MSGKVILCRCEDVSEHDLLHAVALGYRDLEEVKRYTGFGTGPCQGKECHTQVALALSRATGTSPREIAPFTSRAPLTPVPFGVLAASDDSAVGGAHPPDPDNVPHETPDVPTDGDDLGAADARTSGLRSSPLDK